MTLPPLNAVESMRNKENYVHLKFLLSRAKKPKINNIKLELLCGLLSRDGRIPLFSCIRIHGYLGYRFFLDTWIIGYLDIMDTWISWIHGYMDIRFLWIHGYLDTLDINFFHYP